MGPSYTREDMKRLAEMSEPNSIPRIILPDHDYDPEGFRKTLQEYNLSKEIYYLFEAPLKEVPLLMDKGHLIGYIQFRMEIGK